jgi:hypothetical protein
MLKADRIKLNGIYFLKSLNQLQCADCLYLQPLESVRGVNNLIVGWKLKPQDEQHSIVCGQNNQEPRF